MGSVDRLILMTFVQMSHLSLTQMTSCSRIHTQICLPKDLLDPRMFQLRHSFVCFSF